MFFKKGNTFITRNMFHIFNVLHKYVVARFFLKQFHYHYITLKISKNQIEEHRTSTCTSLFSIYFHCFIIHFMCSIMFLFILKLGGYFMHDFGILLVKNLKNMAFHNQ